jgi:hypothetical protein
VVLQQRHQLAQEIFVALRRSPNPSSFLSACLICFILTKRSNHHSFQDAITIVLIMVSDRSRCDSTATPFFPQLASDRSTSTKSDRAITAFKMRSIIQSETQIE